MVVKCRYEGCNINEKNEPPLNKLHSHHIIPKSIGGTDKDGRRWLCKKHHDILHLKLTKIIWYYVPEEKREECKEAIKKFTNSFAPQGKL